MAIEEKEKYKGHTIKQVKGIIEVFNEYFNVEEFDNVIEIGTGTGSFSIYIAEKCKDMGATFSTYDIKPINEEIKKELEDLGCEVNTCDVNDNTGLEAIVKQKGRCLILNDGALKVGQVKRFAKVLKDNDVIMTHDYYKDQTVSMLGTIALFEIDECIFKYNLVIINEGMFDKYLWLCLKKS